jgi:hypothetical protein
MRDISIVFIRERSIVSCLDGLPLVLGYVGLSDLDEFLTPCVHSGIVLFIGFVANPTFDLLPLCIQVGTHCILNLFIHSVLFFLVMNLLALMLRSNLRCGYSFLKLLHHISMIILRR